MLGPRIILFRISLWCSIVVSYCFKVSVLCCIVVSYCFKVSVLCCVVVSPGISVKGHLCEEEQELAARYSLVEIWQ